MSRDLKPLAVLLPLLLLHGCASLPNVPREKYEWPKQAFLNEPTPKRPYVILGEVKARVDYPSMGLEEGSEDALCKNYFNQAVRKLVDYARKKDADAVINIRSVVFMLDGTHQKYPKAECSDEGAEGQILAVGIAVRWKKTE